MYFEFNKEMTGFQKIKVSLKFQLISITYTSTIKSQINHFRSYKHKILSTAMSKSWAA